MSPSFCLILQPLLLHQQVTLVFSGVSPPPPPCTLPCLQSSNLHTYPPPPATPLFTHLALSALLLSCNLPLFQHPDLPGSAHNPNPSSMHCINPMSGILQIPPSHMKPCLVVPPCSSALPPFPCPHLAPPPHELCCMSAYVRPPLPRRPLPSPSLLMPPWSLPLSLVALCIQAIAASVCNAFHAPCVLLSYQCMLVYLMSTCAH